jgi:hypothetical protein
MRQSLCPRRSLAKIFARYKADRLPGGALRCDQQTSSYEPIGRWQRFIPVADMVLAKLARRVTKTLEQTSDGRIELTHSHGRAGKADLGEARANDVEAKFISLAEKWSSNRLSC